MNNKAAVLVVLLIAGTFLSGMPTGSSAASGGHLGGNAQALDGGVDVIYDGTPGSEMIQFIFDPIPSMNITLNSSTWTDLEPIMFNPGVSQDNKVMILDLSNVEDHAFPLGETVLLLSGTNYNKTIYLNVDIGYKISFAPSGASGYTQFLFAYSGDSVTLPECGFVPKSGTEFRGWSLGSSIYQPGDSFTPSADTVMNAVWSGDPAPSGGDVFDIVTIGAIAGIIVIVVGLIIFLITRRGH
jgi:hypothetical protein